MSPILKLIPVLLVCLCGILSHSASADKPNLIVIMADDLGYADVGFNGCQDIPTPNIDSIAEGGVKFSSGYVAYSVCGPSRASFMTGRYGQRFGFERNPQYQPHDDAMGLPLSEKTLATVLGQVGYHSGVIGKWHLGATRKLHPLNRGFNEFYGHLGGGHRYFANELTIKDSYTAKNEAESYRTWIMKNHQPVTPRKYLTDDFSDEAVSFVKRNHAKPFFLFLSYNAPHLPLQASQKYLERFANITDQKRRKYAAMVSAVDDGVGRLLQSLREYEVDRNTMVFFLSDNGGPTHKNASNNHPLRGKKGDAWEGGFRVPFAARWPSGFPRGVTFDHPVSSLDIFATIAALARAPIESQRPLDGINLTPFLTGKRTDPPHKGIFLRKFDQGIRAVRSGDFKLVSFQKSGFQSLYHLVEDIGESQNILEEHPSVEKQLAALWEKWNQSNIEPVFDGLVMAKNDRQKKGIDDPGDSQNAEVWKARFFKRYPQADTNKDGELSWSEYKLAKQKFGQKQKKKKQADGQDNSGDREPFPQESAFKAVATSVLKINQKPAGWIGHVATRDEPVPADSISRPNVILILCDDLNDYVEGFGGHPDALTPNLTKLAKSGVRFTQAHCNIPICGPSRASLFTGIYPHNSGCYGFTKWDSYPVLQNSRTLMDHFRSNGYLTLGTGKLMHHVVRQEWTQFGHRADYGPFAFAEGKKVAHPDVPAPFRNIGAVDGSFGPFVNLAERKTTSGAAYRWQNGGWGEAARPLRVNSPEDRDRTPDEINGDWAVKNLEALAKKTDTPPFFMGVGFIRPHTPLIVPKRFFDMFPLKDIDLPVIRPGDIQDTHARSIRGLPNGSEPTSQRTEDMGARLFRNLVESYPTREQAIRQFIQAYLASVASVDEQIGRIIDVVERSPMKDNTVIVVTSDHGWGMGEKDYLYKNSLWQESTRVPLIIRAPGTAKANADCPAPVSLIDIYPTLVDLCGLSGENRKNEKGHVLDGYSLRPFLTNPEANQWDGPAEVLTALYKWRTRYNPAEESYSLRSRDWRYIRYENGKEELYDTTNDPYEWHNLANSQQYTKRLTEFRQALQNRLPKSDTVPPQPVWQPQKNAPSKTDAESWKDKYFSKHPKADTNQDGELTWGELKAYREKFDPPPTKKKKAKANR